MRWGRKGHVRHMTYDLGKSAICSASFATAKAYGWQYSTTCGFASGTDLGIASLYVADDVATDIANRCRQSPTLPDVIRYGARKRNNFA